MAPTPRTYVSRGGHKLAHALDAFKIDVEGLLCADLGCSTGGFTDCLLQRGAERVHAVDTAYGELAWKLRTDPRVVVHERTNALHMPVAEGVDLVVIDLGWTRQSLAIPVARRWLREGGRIVSLIKPHYEIEQGRVDAAGARGVLSDRAAEAVVAEVVQGLGTLGIVGGIVESPIRGGTRGKGNREWLVLLSCIEGGEKAQEYAPDRPHA